MAREIDGAPYHERQFPVPALLATRPAADRRVCRYRSRPFSVRVGPGRGLSLLPFANSADWRGVRVPVGRRPVRWGQNFLVDETVASHIVDWSRAEGRSVLEIGPGRGILTRLLARRAERLCLVEIDAELAQQLERSFEGCGRVRVVCADVLSLNLAVLLSRPTLVVSNLPYESGTAIVTRLLQQPALIEEMVVMLQKEVCERMLARAGSRSYGPLSVFVTMHADVEGGMVVEPEAFRPRPRVRSRLLRVAPLAEPRYDCGDLGLFRELVQVAFSQRRKMLRNSLQPWLEARCGRSRGGALMAEAGIDGLARAESIDVARFADLSRLLKSARAADA